MVYIKELLPNPAGEESLGEWIRLFNQGEVQVSISGWYISDESGKTYSLSGVGNMNPGETVELRREATGIALNNNGDTLFLYDSNKELQDQLTYKKSVLEDEIIVAERFIPEAPIREGNLQAHTLQSGVLQNNSTIPAFIVGIFIAVTAAVITFMILGREHEKT